ncbi:putative PMT_2 domain-containing protein [Pseudomonas sp. IT-P171]
MNPLNTRASYVIVCMCLAVSFLSLIYSTNIHSDILFMKYLLDDISSGGNWSDWRFSPAPSYFPDLIIYTFAYATTNLAPVQIVLTTAAQATIITFLSIGLINRLSPHASPSAKVVLVALSLICVITTSQYTLDSRIGIFFGSNNIQVPTLISSLAMLWLTLSLLESKSTPKVIAFLVIGALGYASSAIFIICFTLPFIATLSALAIRSKLHNDSENLMRILFVLTLFVISQAVGYAIGKAITYNSPLDGRVPLSIGGAKSSAAQLLKATQFIFDPAASFAFFTAICFFIAFLYAIAKCIKIMRRLIGELTNEAISIPVQVISLFFLLTIASSIFGAILSGGFIDKFGYRYFETFIALSAILSVYFIEKTFGVKTKAYSAICIALFSVLITAAALISLERGRSLPFSELLEHGAFKDQEQSTASCLDNLISGGVPLKAGIADYWMSRGVMFYAKTNIFISQSTDQLSPFFWISSIGPIRQPEKYNASVYNFVIADNGALGRIMGFDTESLKQKIPAGYEVFSCSGTTSEVFYYTGSELDLRVKDIQKKFIFSEFGHGSATFSGAELPGLIGQVDGTGRSASAHDGSGILAFGPYISLPRGKYTATLEFSADHEGDAAPGRIEIGRFDEKNRAILYSGDLPKNRNSIDMEFSIPGGTLDRIEAHVIFNGVGDLTIHNLRFAGDQ